MSNCETATARNRLVSMNRCRTLYEECLIVYIDSCTLSVPLVSIMMSLYPIAGLTSKSYTCTFVCISYATNSIPHSPFSTCTPFCFIVKTRQSLFQTWHIKLQISSFQTSLLYFLWLKLSHVTLTLLMDRVKSLYSATQVSSFLLSPLPFDHSRSLFQVEQLPFFQNR